MLNGMLGAKRRYASLRTIQRPEEKTSAWTDGMWSEVKGSLDDEEEEEEDDNNKQSLEDISTVCKLILS